jgi:hypothetical protein
MASSAASSCWAIRSTRRKIADHYDAGVLTLHIPVMDKAQPRRIEISRKSTEPP